MICEAVTTLPTFVDMRIRPASYFASPEMRASVTGWEHDAIMHEIIWAEPDRLAREVVDKIASQILGKSIPPSVQPFLKISLRTIRGVFHAHGENPEEPEICLLRRQLALVALLALEKKEYSETSTTRLDDLISLAARMKMIPGFRDSGYYGCAGPPSISEIRYIKKRSPLYVRIKALDADKDIFEQVEAAGKSFRYSNDVVFTVDEKFFETEPGVSEQDIVNRMEEVLSAVSVGITDTESLLVAGGILEIARKRRRIYAEKTRQRLADLTSDPDNFDLSIPEETIPKPVWIIFLGGPLKDGRMVDLRRIFSLEHEGKWDFEPRFSAMVNSPPSPISIIRSGFFSNPRFIPKDTLGHEPVHWYIFDALRAYKKIASWFQESCAEIISGKDKRLGYFISKDDNQRRNISYERLTDKNHPLEDYSDYTRFGAYLAKKFYPQVSGIVERLIEMIKEFALYHPFDSIEEHDFVETLREICHRHGYEFDDLMKEWDRMTVAQVIDIIME